MKTIFVYPIACWLESILNWTNHDDGCDQDASPKQKIEMNKLLKACDKPWKVVCSKLILSGMKYLTKFGNYTCNRKRII